MIKNNYHNTIANKKDYQTKDDFQEPQNHTHDNHLSNDLLNHQNYDLAEQEENQNLNTDLDKGFIVQANYQKRASHDGEYQSEHKMEEDLIRRLKQQGYEVIPSDTNLYENLRKQLGILNQVTLNDNEWNRFLDEYLNPSNDGLVEKTRKIQEDYTYDFKFDDGHRQNLKIIDKKNYDNNIFQVTNQVTQKGIVKNRYDVTILINGLPLVHLELKKRGSSIKEAFNQINRYSRETFNIEGSLYKFVQIFIISNGTNTKYFANTTAINKSNFEFTCEWSDVNNKTINDLEDFAYTFLAKKTLLEVICKYSVFDTNNRLLVMRPYQIAATERIIDRVKEAYHSKKWASTEGGGYVWHTTGSGKTLTSFKTARLITELDFIDKVFFVVDRKDLDYQTMKEYNRFQEGSVNGSSNTNELKKNIEDNQENKKIIVTTIQKLSKFINNNPDHPIFNKHCVLIFDECHRSQFGETQKSIQRSFKYYYQFGFTGTPIFKQNSYDSKTTRSVFGKKIHSYTITDAIRDQKVLKFKVDYIALEHSLQESEERVTSLEDSKELAKLEKLLINHQDRISKITQYILSVFNTKTHRNVIETIENKRKNGFNAMFAVQSIEAAKRYYQEFKTQQENLDINKKLNVATIFSYAPNEETNGIKGDIIDENFNPSDLKDLNSKKFLEEVLKDYNKTFNSNFGLDTFQEYYKDLSKRIVNKEVDLVIVVGMFLTGFDAPTLNTLFVDKNLRYHGLIQAFSRTNRIYNSQKSFGNIVCFRKLEEAIDEAIKLYADNNADHLSILEREFAELIEGYIDDNGKRVRGFKDVIAEIKAIDFAELISEEKKKEFIALFNEYLKLENALNNYDEFKEFEGNLTPREVQDTKSTYLEIRDEFRNERISKVKEEANTDFSDIEFYIELLKTSEINLDYIQNLIREKLEENPDKKVLADEITALCRASLTLRPKTELIEQYINSGRADEKLHIPNDLTLFFREKKEDEIANLSNNYRISSHKAREILTKNENGEVAITGTELDELIGNVSRRNGKRTEHKRKLHTKLHKIVETFSEI